MFRNLLIAAAALVLLMLCTAQAEEGPRPGWWCLFEHHGEAGFYGQHLAEVHIDFEAGELVCVDYDGRRWSTGFESDSRFEIWREAAR
jgi:hypothetical protein